MVESNENKPASPTQGEAKRPRRRWLRRLFLVVCLLVVLLGVMVAFAPMAISTDTGRRVVLGMVNEGIAGSIDADGLTVRWGRGQSLSGITVRDSAGAEIAHIGRVELPSASLWSILQGGLALGELEVLSVSADIIGYDDGTTNLSRALMPNATASKPTAPSGRPTSPTAPSTPTTSGSKTAAWPSGLSLGVTLRDVDITYHAQGATAPIRLVIPEAKLAALDPRHMVLELDARLSQGGSRGHQGRATADIRIDDLFDGSGIFQPDLATAKVDAELTDLPVEAVDQLLGRGGKLVVTLGPVLNGHVLADVTASGGTASVQATSEHLDINGKLAFDPSGVTHAGTSTARLTLTPQAWTVLTASDGKPASTLAQPVEVTIKLRRLGLPINDRGLDLANVNLDLGLTLGDTRLLIDGVGEVTLTSTTGGVSTTQLGRLLAANFHTTSSINRKPGGVSLGIELADLIDADQQINTAGLSAKINGQLTNAPVAAILDELLPGVTHGLATRTLGPVVDAEVNLHAAPRAEGQGVVGGFDVDLLTQGGEAGLTSTLIGRFGYDPDTIHADLADGSYARFTLTPGLIQAYRQAFGGPGEKSRSTNASAVSLGGPATFQLDLTEASARLLADDARGYTLDPSSVRMVGRLKSPGLVLDQDGKLAATLEDLLVDIRSEGLAGETRMVLNADIEYPATTGDPPTAGAIESSTIVSGLGITDGAFDMSGASYQTQTHIRQAPIDLIDAVFEMQGELVGALGPRAEVGAVGSYTPGDVTPGGESATGGIDLVLESRTASIDAKLLVVDSRWTLKADAPLKFQVTPRLSQTVLKKINPFLGSAVSAKLPISVNVRQDGFWAPLKNVSLADVNADVLLELGELDLKGEGVLLKLLQQLGAGDSSLLNASFSPVTVSLTGGKLSYQDLTMTVDKVRLIFSGQVDLNSQRLDLSLSIPGDSLGGASWLKGVVSEDQAIVIPLTGTFDKPELDFGLLTREIAKAALDKQIKDEVTEAIRDKIGGEGEVLLGGLLNELLKAEQPDTQPDETSTQPDEQAQPQVSEAEALFGSLLKELLKDEQPEQEQQQDSPENQPSP